MPMHKDGCNRVPTSFVRMGVASAFRVGGVTKPNQSRSLGGGGIQAHTVPCSECMSTSIRKCILHGYTLSVSRAPPMPRQATLPAYTELTLLLCACAIAKSCMPLAQGWRGSHARGCCRRGSRDASAGLGAHLEMCSAVISARLRMRLAAKLRSRCSCPTFFCALGSLPAAAAPPGNTLKPWLVDSTHLSHAELYDFLLQAMCQCPWGHGGHAMSRKAVHTACSSACNPSLHLCLVQRQQRDILHV